jgi:hypothetical protein
LFHDARIPSHFCGTVALKPTSGRLFESKNFITFFILHAKTTVWFFTDGRRGGVGSGAKAIR